MNTDWLATGKPRGHFMCVSCPRRSPRFLAQSNSYRMNTVLPHGLILAKIYRRWNLRCVPGWLAPGIFLETLISGQIACFKVGEIHWSNEMSKYWKIQRYKNLCLTMAGP